MSEPIGEEFIPPPRLVQPSSGSGKYIFEVKDTVIMKYIEKFNLNKTEKEKINFSALKILHEIKLFGFAKKTLRYETEVEAENRKERFFSSFFRVLSNNATDEDDISLLSNRRHDYNPQENIVVLADFDLRMKLFMDMHRRIFNNAEELKDRIRETCILIAARKKLRIVIEQVDVEVQCVGERAFDVKRVSIDERRGAVEEEAMDERVDYETADDELDKEELPVDKIVPEDFEREDERTPPIDENRVPEGEQPVEKHDTNARTVNNMAVEVNAVEEQKLDENVVESNSSETKLPKRIRINFVKLVRRPKNPHKQDSCSSLFILLSLVFYHVLVCYCLFMI